MRLQNFVIFSLQITINKYSVMIYSLKDSRAISYFYFFTVCLLAAVHFNLVGVTLRSDFQ